MRMPKGSKLCWTPNGPQAAIHALPTNNNQNPDIPHTSVSDTPPQALLATSGALEPNLPVWNEATLLDSAALQQERESKAGAEEKLAAMEARHEYDMKLRDAAAAELAAEVAAAHALAAAERARRCVGRGVAPVLRRWAVGGLAGYSACTLVVTYHVSVDLAARTRLPRSWKSTHRNWHRSGNAWSSGTRCEAYMDHYRLGSDPMT